VCAPAAPPPFHERRSPRRAPSRGLAVRQWPPLPGSAISGLTWAWRRRDKRDTERRKMAGQQPPQRRLQIPPSTSRAAARPPAGCATARSGFHCGRKETRRARGSRTRDWMLFLDLGFHRMWTRRKTTRNKQRHSLQSSAPARSWPRVSLTRRKTEQVRNIFTDPTVVVESGIEDLLCMVKRTDQMFLPLLSALVGRVV
jgi:hypothetical protein